MYFLPMLNTQWSAESLHLRWSNYSKRYGEQIKYQKTWVTQNQLHYGKTPPKVSKKILAQS